MGTFLLHRRVLPSSNDDYIWRRSASKLSGSIEQIEAAT